MKPKVYLAHSSKFDYKNDLYLPIKRSSLPSLYEFIYLLDNPQNLPNTKDMIQTFQVVIGEISYPSTGAGIEIGWADAFGIPIILIHNQSYSPPDYYKTLSSYIIEYDNSEKIPDLIATPLKLISSINLA
jgi:hypothetical protein